MSFGGSVHAAIITMRNNRNLLSKKRSYKALKESLLKEYDLKAHQSKKAYQGKEVPPEELEQIKFQIKQDLRAQKKRLNILSYSITVLLLVILSWIIFM